MRVGVGLKTGTQKISGGISSTIQQIVQGTFLDFDFSKSQTYPGSGQIITDIISGITATLGANDGVAADDPTFSSGALVFNGSQFCLTQSNPDEINDLFNPAANDFAVVTVAFKSPDAFNATGHLLGAYGNGGSYVNGWRIQSLLTSGTLRFTQEGGDTTAGNQSIAGIIADTNHTLTLQADLQNNIFYVSLDGDEFGAGVAYVFNDYDADADGPLALGGLSNGADKIAAGFELYRVALAITDGLLNDTQALAIHNQLVSDHSLS